MSFIKKSIQESKIRPKKINAKIVLLSAITLFAISMTFLPFSVSACYIPPSESEYAIWKDSNGQQYLDIKTNDYYTLGTLEGSNLAEQIITMKLSIQAMIQNYNIPYEYLMLLASYYLPYIPSDYITEMQGMSDALISLGITFEDILIQNTFMDIYYGQLIPLLSGYPQPPIEIGCTAIGVKNEGGLTTTIGQNFDFAQFLHPTLAWVKHKVGDQQTIFSLRMGAMIGLPTGKNSKGVISLVNVVETIITGSFGLPATVRTRLAFEGASNLNEFFTLIYADNFPASFNLVVGDKQLNVVGAEHIPNTYTSTTLNIGEFIVKTNTFLTPEFRPFLVSQEYSMNRQYKAEELVSNAIADGSLSLPELITILQFKDGTDASICRNDSTNPLESQTGAFMGVRSTKWFNWGFFGLGNLLDNNAGIIPL